LNSLSLNSSGVRHWTKRCSAVSGGSEEKEGDRPLSTADMFFFEFYEGKGLMVLSVRGLIASWFVLGWWFGWRLFSRRGAELRRRSSSPRSCAPPRVSAARKKNDVKKTPARPKNPEELWSIQRACTLILQKVLAVAVTHCWECAREGGRHAQNKIIAFKKLAL
jgi:hypothetical protein